MNRKIVGISVLFLLIVSAAFGQLKRANKYYDNLDYAKAIPLYKKVVKKNEQAEPLRKLANSYKAVKDYPQAELYYARLMNQQNTVPMDHFQYGMVLKNNNKIDLAKEQFKIYASTAPSDKIAQISVKSCDDIKLWISKTQQFEVNPVENINTIHSEFCPVFYKGQMVFVSERTKDIINYTEYEWNDEPFLNVYSSKMSTGGDGKLGFSKKVKTFSSTINTNFHDGPVCFNQDQTEMYITRVNYKVIKKDKQFVNRPGIYISHAKGTKWSKAKPLPFNSDSYSVAHPSLSADGQTLYFASDMPGGQGGMDLYKSTRNGDTWSTPVNLGPDINSYGNDEFPFIRKDGTLYFSSDGRGGFGGLDVYVVSKTDAGTEVKNLGAPLNSYTDDFGIIFSDDFTKGYFSSDRQGGKGADDIYSFVALNKYLTVAGKILLSKDVNDVAGNAEVMLLTEDGKLVKVSTTDKNGFFKFDNLDPDSKYLVKLDETDPRFANKKKYYMADEDGKIIRVTVINDKGGKFVFTNLPADPNALPELGADDVSIAGNLLYGESPSKPLANTKVDLVNDKGEVVQSVTTNAFGAFVFKNLPPDENFIVKVDESDTQLSPNTKIIITNKSGKEMQTTSSGNKGDFKFSFLAADKNSMKLMVVEDSELRFDLKGNLLNDSKDPLANSVINLVDENGTVIQSVKTDGNGSFSFVNLPADKNILFSLDETDPKMKSFTKLYITDAKGNVIKELTKINGSFKFTILPVDQNKIGVVYVDDPWLKVLQLKNETRKDSLTIVENIYYNYGEYKILPEAEKTLDKVINIMKNDPQLNIELSSHTDSRSSAEYNMKLSQQRAKAAVDYIVNKGISRSRISGKGYGESRLINRCADGVECSEEEHAKNRRTEFKILRKQG